MTTHRESSAPLIIAHRGASRDFPENTLAAFRGAIDQGADWVELDVRRTADGVLVVHHDAWVTATPGATPVAIADVSADALPADVPTLAAALAGCEHLGVNVEIKHGRHEPGFDDDRSLADAVVAAIGAADRPTLRCSSRRSTSGPSTGCTSSPPTCRPAC